MQKSLTTSAALLACFAVVEATDAAVIFQDDFTGHADTGADGLNGETPDVGSVNWVAPTLFGADGTVSSGRGSATLAFTPVDNTTYTLDATIVKAGSDWIGVGFANGQSTSTGNNTRFTASGAGKVGGRGWAIFRADTGTRNTFSGSNTNNPEAWIGLTGDLDDTIDIRLVLFDADATASTDWQVNYFAKLPSSGSYTQIRASAGDVNEDINSVGFALNDTGAGGTLVSFSLSDDSPVPEPGSLALLGLGGLCVLRRRRA